MKVQYVYDKKGKKTDVIIPLELWEEIKEEVEERRAVKEEVFIPSEYRGIYKDSGIDLEEEIGGLREEWIRNI